MSRMNVSALRNEASSVDNIVLNSDGTVGGVLGTTLAAKVGTDLVDAKGDLLMGTAADTVGRLAVGTDGQVLTADSASAGGVKWAAAPVAGLNLVQSYSVAGASSLFINGCFTSAYRFYRIVACWSASANVSAVIQLLSGGTPSTANIYFLQINQAGGTGATISRTQSTSWTGIPSSTYPTMLVMDIGRPAEATYTVINGQIQDDTNNGTVRITDFGGTHTANTAYDGISLATSSGILSGFLNVYGYKD